MTNVAPGFDLALIAVYVFFGFFISLLLYLRREDRREGYPLEHDPSGRTDTATGFLFTAFPKTFHLPFGRGDFLAPNNVRDRRSLAAKRTSIVPGSPLVPTGNPMIDGVGPGSYAERAKVPDLTAHGYPKIVPMRVATEFAIAKGDADPRGFAVIGTDGNSAGTVSDVWIDRGETMIRYLEIALASGGGTVLVPMTMVVVDKGRKRITVDAITSTQFADVPRTESPDQITFYEEERIVAYYGGGFLYATPGRLEPFL